MERPIKKNIFLHTFLSVLLILLPFLSHAQENYAKNTEMAEILYQNGKIYLVVFVMATIFVGIILYLIRIERKLNKLENNNN